MTPKYLTTLGAIAAVSIAATAWVSHSSAPSVASDRRGERVLPSLLAKANDIVRLSIREGAETFAIERRDNRFVRSGSGYPIKTEAVSDVVASTAELTFQEARTSDPSHFGDLDLADPGAEDGGKEITFGTAGGDLATLLIGKSDATVGGQSGGTFIRLKGQVQTYLVRGSVRLPYSRSGWFVPISFEVKRSEIKKVELAGGGRDGVTLLPDTKNPGRFVLADVPDNRTPDDLKASVIPNIVANFAFEDVRAAIKPAADDRRMVAEAGDGLQIIITVLGEAGEGWVHVKAEAANDAAKDKAALINSKVEGYDFRLRSSDVERLGWTMADLSAEPKG